MSHKVDYNKGSSVIVVEDKYKEFNISYSNNNFKISSRNYSAYLTSQSSDNDRLNSLNTGDSFNKGLVNYQGTGYEEAVKKIRQIEPKLFEDIVKAASQEERAVMLTILKDINNYGNDIIIKRLAAQKASGTYCRLDDREYSKAIFCNNTILLFLERQDDLSQSSSISYQKTENSFSELINEFNEIRNKYNDDDNKIDQFSENKDLKKLKYNFDCLANQDLILLKQFNTHLKDSIKIYQIALKGVSNNIIDFNDFRDDLEDLKDITDLLNDNETKLTLTNMLKKLTELTRPRKDVDKVVLIQETSNVLDDVLLYANLTINSIKQLIKKMNTLTKKRLDKLEDIKKLNRIISNPNINVNTRQKNELEKNKNLLKSYNKIVQYIEFISGDASNLYGNCKQILTEINLILGNRFKAELDPHSQISDTSVTALNRFALLLKSVKTTNSNTNFLNPVIDLKKAIKPLSEYKSLLNFESIPALEMNIQTLTRTIHFKENLLRSSEHAPIELEDWIHRSDANLTLNFLVNNELPALPSDKVG